MTHSPNPIRLTPAADRRKQTGEFERLIAAHGRYSAAMRTFDDAKAERDAARDALIAAMREAGYLTHD